MLLKLAVRRSAMLRLFGYFGAILLLASGIAKADWVTSIIKGAVRSTVREAIEHTPEINRRAMDGALEEAKRDPLRTLLEDFSSACAAEGVPLKALQGIAGLTDIKTEIRDGVTYASGLSRFPNLGFDFRIAIGSTGETKNIRVCAVILL